MDRNLHARTTVNPPSVSSREAARRQVDADVAAFLAAGGKILQVGNLDQAPPFGAPLRKSNRDVAVTIKKVGGVSATADKRRRWTPEREQLLTEKFEGGTPLDEIATLFGVSKSVIKLKVYELGLKRPAVAQPEKPVKKKRQKWTPERIHILESNYGVIDTARLAAMLGVGAGSVYVKASELGFTARRRSA